MVRWMSQVASGGVVLALALALGGVVLDPHDGAGRVRASSHDGAADPAVLAVPGQRGGAVLSGSAAEARPAEPRSGQRRASADLPLHNLSLGAGDTVSIPAASRSEARASLAAEERAGVSFAVEIDGATHELTTTAPTLHAALAEAGIVLGWDDLVSHELAAAPPAGARVSVARGETSYLTEQVHTPFEVEERTTAELAAGERRVAREGVDGLALVTYRVRSVGEEEVARERVLEAVGTEPVSQIVEIGTRTAVVAPATGATGTSTGQGAGSSGGSGAGASRPTGSAVASTEGNRALGRELMLERGFAAEEWSCLEALWTRESNWNHLAANPTSSARGIPQAMMSAHFGASWRDPSNTAAQQYLSDPATQIRWGLDYIAGRYTTPCAAWGHSQAKGWY